MTTELEQAIENLPHPLTMECKFLGYFEDQAQDWFYHKWLVTLRYNGQTYSTEYNMGIGHANSPRKGNNYVFYSSTACAPENWRTDKSVDAANFRARWYSDKRSAPTPKIADVLYCLLSDSQSGSQSFEDFCSDFGYDTDSRKAHATWETCKNIFIGLHVLFMNDYGLLEGKQH
jgi:hypothetical protein